MSHIFISYSRKDLNLAQEIVNALGAEGLETWIDWKSIPKGEDWEQEIYRGIEAADAFLFLISPDSVKSVMCNKEVLHAIRNNKRILPILLREADTNVFVEQAAGTEIMRLNWIHCRKGQDDFEGALRSARDTIRTDFDWLRFHTILQTQALAWERARRDGSRLLRGKQLKEAQEQVARARTAEPLLTDIQRTFISESRQAARRRQALPYQAVLALAAVIFLGGKFYYRFIPIPPACPQLGKVSIQLDASALPEELRRSLSETAEQARAETSLGRCSLGEEGLLEARAEYDPETGLVELSARLPETPAYRLDLLQEIRAFGPEQVSETGAAALLRAFAAYAVGEYPRAIELLDGYNSLSALTLLAQARLFTDDLPGSRQAYERALQVSTTDPAYTGKLQTGAALAWWRPESYYLLSSEGKKDDCLRAAQHYVQAEKWITADTLAHNIRTTFAWFCVDENDPSYAAYAAWKQEPAQSQPDPNEAQATETHALAEYLLALEQGSDQPDTHASYVDRLTRADSLMLAQAALSEFYWGVEDNCREARTWRERFRAGMVSDVEREKLRRLLQTQPLVCW